MFNPFPPDFDTVLLRINKYILNPFIGFLFVLATVYFLYGLGRYFLAGEGDEDRIVGKRHMLWGLTGMFVMATVFGIMHLIVNTFGINLGDIGVVF